LYQQIALFNPLDRSLALLLFGGFSYGDMAEIWAYRRQAVVDTETLATRAASREVVAAE
jgi:hypothetical protein